MIDGVVVKKLKVVPDERGRLMEILRRDDEMFVKFGQVYMTTTYPQVVKAWHYHEKQDDFITCVKGMLKLVLFDDRQDSPTRGEINESSSEITTPALSRSPEKSITDGSAYRKRRLSSSIFPRSLITEKIPTNTEWILTTTILRTDGRERMDKMHILVTEAVASSAATSSGTCFPGILIPSQTWIN